MKNPIVLVLGLFSLLIAVMAGLLFATPMLNLDDLVFLDSVPNSVAAFGLPRFLWIVLTNADFGVTQIRTYNLARAVQIVTVELFGKTPWLTFAFIAALHAASGWIVYRLFRDMAGDRLTALFAAAVWVAAPSVLPFLRVEHHFLYLIAPYDPLLLWLWLTSRARVGLAGGTALLCLSWFLGEGVIIPMAAAVAAMAWARRDRLIALQGAIAFAVLALYLGWQKFFVSDPALIQRLTLRDHTLKDFLDGVVRAFAQVPESANAFLGRAYHDAELGGAVGGLGVYTSPVPFIIALAVLAVAGIAAWRAPLVSAPAPMDMRVPWIFAGVSVLSLALYPLFTAVVQEPFAVRYAAAFFALLPLGVIAALIALRLRRAARLGAAALAALAFAVSIGVLLRVETQINAPNRATLAGLKPGTALVAVHRALPLAADGQVSGAYPGLKSIFGYGVADPFRSAWTTNVALMHYAGVILGSACRRAGDGRVAVTFSGEPRGEFAPEAVKVISLESRDAREAETLSVDEACPQAQPIPNPAD